jgi:uncharacterized repeat protein (TIGR03843 family)
VSGFSDTDLTVLQHGELTITGRLTDASNATLYSTASLDGVDVTCVYKPIAGERPLWDFPGATLARREVAAYAVSEATNWTIVPPTILRDGPFGPGMVQLWVDAEGPEGLVDVTRGRRARTGWFAIMEGIDIGGERVVLSHRDEPHLRAISVFDAVINNADRKGCHLLAADEVIFGIDHGLTFHTENKLRTVLWGWAGDPVLAEHMEVLRVLLAELDGALGRELSQLLTVDEVTATRHRTELFLTSGVHPLPHDQSPAVPWPPL